MLIFCTSSSTSASLCFVNPKNPQGLFPSKARSDWIFWVKNKAMPVHDYERPVGFQEVEVSRVINNQLIKEVRI